VRCQAYDDSDKQHFSALRPTKTVLVSAPALGGSGEGRVAAATALPRRAPSDHVLQKQHMPLDVGAKC